MGITEYLLIMRRYLSVILAKAMISILKRYPIRSGMTGFVLQEGQVKEIRHNRFFFISCFSFSDFNLQGVVN